jgi:hypothetical protein
MNSPDPIADPMADPSTESVSDERTDDPSSERAASEIDEIRDELPEDLQPEFAGAYQFPDNSRRRIPGAIYLVLAVLCFIAWTTSRDSSALVNGGIFWAGVLLAIAGLISISSGWRMHVDERDALVAAQQAIGFPVGHASAQQVWHGIRSRPTWRVFCYSAEDPPRQRGLVLVDAVDGHVVQHLSEPNPDLEQLARPEQRSG